MPSNEFFETVNGRKTDRRLHEEILDNPEADKTVDDMAVARAIADGMSRELAEHIYRTRPTPKP